jgi:hypothetical protein
VRGFIRGYGLFGGLAPLKGATVTISGPNGIWRTTTDANGFYVIFAITPGKYQISARKNQPGNYVPWENHPWPWFGLRYVCVHAGEDRTISLDLPQVGPHGFFYAPWVRKNLEMLQYQPDASQSADVYSLGDC